MHLAGSIYQQNIIIYWQYMDIFLLLSTAQTPSSRTQPELSPPTCQCFEGDRSLSPEKI